MVVFFFFKQKTAYEMRISDWSSDVCSADLRRRYLPRRLSSSALWGSPQRLAYPRYAASTGSVAPHRTQPGGRVYWCRATGFFRSYREEQPRRLRGKRRLPSSAPSRAAVVRGGGLSAASDLSRVRRPLAQAQDHICCGADTAHPEQTRRNHCSLPTHERGKA